jgi:hypothetical protein
VTHDKQIIKTIARKGDIARSSPERHTTLRQAAETLSLRNVDQSVCELMNEALARLVVLAYEQDSGGFCNIDRATGKLLIPLPFGRLGHARWGVRPIEAVILRQILFDWQRAGSSLFLYDKSRRAWFVNIRTFTDALAANRWLTQHQIDVATYRAARVKKLG